MEKQKKINDFWTEIYGENFEDRVLQKREKPNFLGNFSSQMIINNIRWKTLKTEKDENSSEFPGYEWRAH